MKRLRTIIESPKKWLTDSDHILIDELRYIEEDIADQSLAGINGIATFLGLFGTYFGIQARFLGPGYSPPPQMGAQRETSTATYKFRSLLNKLKDLQKYN